MKHLISLQSEILTRGVEEVIVREHMEETLASGEKLRVKFGIDPTAPDLHLGHTVPLRKLRAFQDLGHQAVLIIGDFTAMVGDPSGRAEARRLLTEKDVHANMKRYLGQVGMVLDLQKAEIRHNSEWYKGAGTAFLYDLFSKVTVQRATERDDFQKRLAHQQDVSVLEVIYPLLQGYDSVAVKADIEIGGSDQKFNLLMGRRIQRRYAQKEQDILTTWLIEGTDGVRKMSKSVGNYIGLTEASDSMFGKLMSIPDDLIIKYFIALTAVSAEEIEEMKRAMWSNELNPRDAKLKLAEVIVGMYHGAAVAKKERERFIATFSEGRTPDEMPEISLQAAEWIAVDLVMATGLTASRSEARDLINQGAIRVDGKIITLGQVIIKKGTVIKVGKRRFVRIV